MRLIGLLLCLTNSAQAIAQAPARSEPAFSTKGAFFAISVDDIPASTLWYKEKLGMDVTFRANNDAGPAVVVLEGGGLIVEILREPASAGNAAAGANQGGKGRGITKAGVVVDDFDATFARLKARGVSIAYGPFPKTAEQRANVIVRDNSGNLLQFFGPR